MVLGSRIETPAHIEVSAFTFLFLIIYDVIIFLIKA